VFLPGGYSVEAAGELAFDPLPFTWGEGGQSGFQDVESDPEFLGCFVVYSALTPQHCVDEVRECDHASGGDLVDDSFFASGEVWVWWDGASFEVAHFVGERGASFSLPRMVVELDPSWCQAAF